MALYIDMNREQKKKVPLLVWCLIISFALHLGLAFRQSQLRLANLENEKSSPEPIELAELPKNFRLQDAPKPETPKRTNEQQMAETEDAHNREIDPSAKFLGEHNQKALQQTKAKRIDDFSSKKGTGAKSQVKTADSHMAPSGDAEKKETAEEAVEGDGTAESQKKTGSPRNWKTLSLKDLGVGGDGGAEAATDDSLKGVQQGEGTVLSTREFRFYSYYHRIKELLRQYWKPTVERQITRIWRKGKNINSDELTTKVLVLLDETGKIQKISKVASSGFSELDEAAIEAFQRAAPFPNPPKGIVDPDGFVRIRWDFILQTEAGPAIQWRQHGGVPN